MTDKSKPWLAAKTAGDAFLTCTKRYGQSWAEDGAQAVIEWHEAQRVKVSERWEVEQYGRRVSGVVFATSKLAHLSARINDRVTVVKVTRYRRKGAKR